MKLEAGRMALAAGATAAILWILCSTFVALMGGATMSMTGSMLHMNMNQFGWTLTFSGFLVGLVLWVVWSAVAGWLVAAIYNALGGSRAPTT